ncbi:hypothetical protein [Kroppenstedtia guangzhouensis]|uniref:hypothetical protein n=1 Tax=Kroppenstedtia guangzhouensis TaxID=1274356 RepID=UPI00166E17C9|nr:hypothetical protein [Kroppenstedtia guangzhouensis]
MRRPAMPFSKVTSVGSLPKSSIASPRSPRLSLKKKRAPVAEAGKITGETWVDSNLYSSRSGGQIAYKQSDITDTGS